MKICRTCESEVPLGTTECPICGAMFDVVESGERDDGDVLGTSDAQLVEVKLLKKSPFRWCDLFGSGKIMVASGFEAKAFVVSKDNKTWHALGKVNGEGLRKLSVSDVRGLALAAADDFMREYETDDSARKSKRWLNDPASVKQIEQLHNFGYDSTYDLAFTKYSAACHMNFQWTRQGIERLI